MNEQRGLRIGQVARATGVSTKTLRYYEAIGLLKAARRSPAGYRVYEEDAITQVRFVRSAQALGLRLKDIAVILQVRNAGRPPCTHVLALVERELAALEDRIEEFLRLQEGLQTLRERLVKRLAENAAQGIETVCPCLDEVQAMAFRTIVRKRM